MAKEKKVRLVVTIRPEQRNAIKQLAQLASTSESEVIRQIIDAQESRIVEAIQTWKKHGGLMKPHRKGKGGFKAILFRQRHQARYRIPGTGN